MKEIYCFFWEKFCLFSTSLACTILLSVGSLHAQPHHSLSEGDIFQQLPDADVLQETPSCSVNPRIRKIDANVSDRIKTYMEYLPVNYNSNPTAKYPLLIFVPGAGEILLGPGGGVGALCTQLNLALPRVINQYRFPDAFIGPGNQQFSFIVIAPFVTSLGNMNNAFEINAVINFMVSNYRVDPRRIYTTGISLGSAILMDHASSSITNGQRIAGVNPMASCIDNLTNFATRTANMANANVHYWGISCVQDAVPYCSPQTSQNWANAMNSIRPGIAKFTPYPCDPPTAHPVWYIAYEPTYKENNKNVYEWLLQYSSNVALPAILKDYTTALNNNKVTIQWTTTFEDNTDHFIVERSLPNQSFEAIAVLPAAGSSFGNKKYVFTDNQPLSGTSLYRLSLVNKDSEKELFEVKKISIPSRWRGIVNIPGNVKNILPIYINVERRSQVRVSLYDLNGKLINHFEKVFSPGVSLTNLDVTMLSQGTYLVRIQNEDELTTRKVVIN